MAVRAPRFDDDAPLSFENSEQHARFLHEDELVDPEGSAKRRRREIGGGGSGRSTTMAARHTLSLDQLARNISPDDVGFRYRLVATSDRRYRETGERLSQHDRALVFRVAKVWFLAAHVWKGDDAARRFLNRPHPLLSGQVPLVVTLESDAGAERVTGILGRLLYGTAA